MSAPTTVTEIIPVALGGERIDRIVAMVTGLSRRQSVALIAEGKVTVDGDQPVKPSVRVEAEAEVVIEVPEISDELLAEPDVAFDVVYSDDQVVVIDKPAGLVVHPGSGVASGTMVNGLLARFPALAALEREPGQGQRPGIVHRLDRGTSGLLVAALTVDAYHDLVSQFAARSVARHYVALLVGTLESEAGLIDAPLGRSPRDPTRRAVVADGKSAKTHYNLTSRFDEPPCSLVQCRLETGRTHQIRAHFAAIDHPVVGDERYGGSALGLAVDRPFLHAAELGFEHPVSGKGLHFESAVPDDLASVLSDLEGVQGE